MRVSSSLFFQTGVKTINTQQADLMHLYQQIGTGKRMITPSDDPLAAAQTINIAQSQSLNARYTENRQVAKTALATEENTLTSVSSLLQGIKTRLVEAGNGTLSDADRTVLANVLSNAKDNLMGLANATDGSGQYLFSGHAGSRPPFVASSTGAVSYQGDEGRRLIQVDQTRQLDSADTGREIFMSAAPGARDYITMADLGNTGTGVIESPIITNPKGAYVGESFQIDFTEAADGTMQYSFQVFDADGNVLSGPTTPVNYSPDNASLDLPGGVQVKFSGVPADGDTFRVEPVFLSNPHVAAASAGWSGGATLGKPQVTDPAGANVSAELSVVFGAETAPGSGIYDYTVTDNSTPPVATTLQYDSNSGDPLDLGGGMQVALSGVPVSGDAFTVKPVEAPANLNIFDSIDAMIAALERPTVADPAARAMFSNVLASTMQRVDVVYDQVLTVRSSVGTRMAEIAAIDDNASLRGLSYAQDLSRLEDVDYYEATAQLQLRTAALEAASMAFKKIQATSLFNMNN